jgi:phage gp46-like protein
MIRLLYDNDNQRGDLDRTGDKNLVSDLDLETAVLISLYTEARVKDDDERYDDLLYKGGWWGANIPDVPGVDIAAGSRLWTLRGRKATQNNVNLAGVYAREALQWFLDDGIAKSVTVSAERGTTPIDLQLNIDITRLDNSKWSSVWEVQLNGI